MPGLVLSGGGVRAAYQVGALKAIEKLLPGELDRTSIVLGSSIGAVNGLVFSACLSQSAGTAISTLEEVWLKRKFSNTFNGSPTRAFIRAMRTAIMQYMSPGPQSTDRSIFDPTPLMTEVDTLITQYGGLRPEARAKQLKAVGVMTTIEGLKGEKRKPLLFLSSHIRLSPEELQGAWYDICYDDHIHARHGFGSAALPSVMPPVDLNTDNGSVRVVDGGISQNVPVDPAVRLGAERIIIVDISGRTWWQDKYGESHDHRPTWEVPSEHHTYCVRPPETLTIRPKRALGPLLKHTAGTSTRRFMSAVGPIWPMFQLVKAKLGEEAAYEVMSYVAMDPEYLNALIETGYHETVSIINAQHGMFVCDWGETAEMMA